MQEKTQSLKTETLASHQPSGVTGTPTEASPVSFSRDGLRGLRPSPPAKNAIVHSVGLKERNRND